MLGARRGGLGQRVGARGHPGDVRVDFTAGEKGRAMVTDEATIAEAGPLRALG